MDKHKIVVFTGAGISASSGINTFRDDEDAFWVKYDPKMFATSEAITERPEDVYEFHNVLRRLCVDKTPTKTHLSIKDMEELADVTIVTQNIDNLHEKAGSTNILHLHGEIMKSRDIDGNIFDLTGDLKVGDKSPNGLNLRPHTVLFGEYPYNIDDSIKAIQEADVILIIGTSFNISYTSLMIRYAKDDAYVININPEGNLNWLNLIQTKTYNFKADDCINNVYNEIKTYLDGKRKVQVN